MSWLDSSYEMVKYFKEHRDYKNMAIVLEQLSEIIPFDPQYPYNAGVTLIMLKRDIDAEYYLNRALLLDPRDEKIYIALAAAYYKEKQMDSFQEVMDRLSQLKNRK
jgi:tetratricopeptide (TPR) repeat protein